MIKLEYGERIIAVVPEYCAGPGWSNTPMWVYIVNHQSKQFRQECIQPDEQTSEMKALFEVGEVTSRSLITLATRQLMKREKTK